VSVPTLAGIKVLVVDDDSVLRIAADLLTEAGADVTPAASAREALAVFDDARFDVVVTDVFMPELDGYGFLGKLRQRPEDKGGRVPVIALTGHAVDERAGAAAFAVCLQKPTTFESLVAAVASVCDTR
jgi:two-component system CheB/CheR fusion protein